MECAGTQGLYIECPVLSAGMTAMEIGTVSTLAVMLIAAVGLVVLALMLLVVLATVRD
jgi:hypothetical protein